MRKQIIPLMLFFVLIVLAGCGSGETSEGSPIEFTGDVQSVEDDVIVVGGFTVDVSEATVPARDLEIGETVRVTGLSQDGGRVRAIVVVLVEDEQQQPAETDEPVVEPEPTDEPVVEPEPTDEPVVEPEPTDEPVVEPEPTDEPTAEPEPTDEASADDDTPPYVVIEGVVQEIHIDYITILDIDIEVDPADPILTQIRIGDTIRIEGASSFENNTIIIVAINITIIESTIVVIENPVYVVPGLPSNCRRTPKGKVTCKTTKKSKKSD